MAKIIRYNCRKANGLSEPICDSSHGIQKIKCTDREISGVIYRVWSAFQNKIKISHCLENLMLSSLEKEEEQ